MHCLSQALKKSIDMVGAANVVYGNILFVTRLAPVTLSSGAEKSPREARTRYTYRMAIFPGLTRGDVFGVFPPSNLLATVTDSKDGYLQVKDSRIDVFARSVHGFLEYDRTNLRGAPKACTDEGPGHNVSKLVLTSKVKNKVLTSAKDNSFGRPSQVLELGGARQHLSIHIKRSKTS